jgi:hypothetical protein
METYDGTLWAEPNPLPDGQEVPLQLPTVELPDDVDTIPVRAANGGGKKRAPDPDGRTRFAAGVPS